MPGTEYSGLNIFSVKRDSLRKLRPIREAEIIAEFLRSEFHHPEFHRDRERFEAVVLQPNLNDQTENALRRQLLFRRHGRTWRELPPDTAWWEVELDRQDIDCVRLSPRPPWNEIANDSMRLIDIVERISTGHLTGHTASKVQSIHYHLQQSPCGSALDSVLLIGVEGEKEPLTVLDGNHRLIAALLCHHGLPLDQFRLLCGLSPGMNQCCSYEINSATNLRNSRLSRLRGLFGLRA